MHVLTWKLTTHVEPTPENVSFIPFVVDDLAVVRTPDAHSATSATGPASVGEFAHDGEFARNGEFAYDGDFTRSVTESSENLPFDVSVHRDLTASELREVLSQDQAFLHYIGHIDAEGFECTDGNLDVTHTKSGVAFLLDIETSDDETVEFTIRSYVSGEGGMGGFFRPRIDESQSYRLTSSEHGPMSLTREQLATTFALENVPVKSTVSSRGAVTWTSMQSEFYGP